MDDLIFRLKQLTEQLVCEIDTVTYEQIDSFIEAREVVITNIKQSESERLFTDQDKEHLTGVLAFDPIIQKRITYLKDEASQGLAKLSIARNQKVKYAPDYQPDSIFFDKKK
jgi:hypothetical protein